VPGGLAIVQDDAHFVAVFDPTTGRTSAIPLPEVVDGRRQFDDRRGNKAHKLDLEACVAAPDGTDTLFLALGSGSTPRRERAAVVTGWAAGEPVARVVPLPRLYAALRAERRFSGSEMNVEGAALLGHHLRLFGRGNGAARDDDRPVNATCDLDWAALVAHLHDPAGAPAPAPSAIVQYDLGEIDGVPLGFTDGIRWGDGVLYAAAAEASADAVQDGEVLGSAIGVIDAAGRARWTLVRDADGAPFTAKVEGVLAGDEPGRLLVVVDVDDPDVPSELCVVEIEGA
jgi:hypothetical protein